MARVWADWIEHFPPVVQLLLRNVYHAPVSSIEEMHGRIRDLLPELRRQATATVNEALQRVEHRLPYAGASVLNLTGALDPLSRTHKCVHLQCRVNAAKQIARFVGIYADAAYIPDPFTAAFAFTERWTIGSSRDVMEQMTLLSELIPLVKEDILKFSLPVVPMCASCMTEVKRRIAVASRRVVAEYGDSISVAKHRNRLLVDPRDFDYTGIVYRNRLTSANKAQVKRGTSIETVGREAYAEILAEHTHETLLCSAVSLPFGAVTLTGSRANLLTMRSLESLLPSASELQSWEASRATELPWIRDLSIDRVLELRQKAARALPRLRSRMTTAFLEAKSSDTSEIGKVISELHNDAVEVEGELRALNVSGERRFRNIVGTLGITISMYGFAAEFATATGALVGLMSTLGLIHPSARKDHQDLGKLVSRPGFVLVKARDLLVHAKHVT